MLDFLILALLVEYIICYRYNFINYKIKIHLTLTTSDLLIR